MYTGADLQNVCREAALIALRTRVLGDAVKAKDNEKSKEPVVSALMVD